jgi:hypothetical protein
MTAEQARLAAFRTASTDLSTESVSKCAGIARNATVVALLLGFAATSGPADASGDGREAVATAASYLAIDTVLDGKCYILSEGGKLARVQNTHPSRGIQFRLQRIFADRPQGIVTGTLPPGGEPQALGCDRVDGRPQTWRVQRADYIDQ